MVAFVICVLLAGFFAVALFGTVAGLAVAVAVAAGLGWKALTSDWFV
jgi:hypothetical protein